MTTHIAASYDTANDRRHRQRRDEAPRGSALFRMLAGTLGIVMLGLLGHAIAAVELTLAGLGVIALSGFAASAASEAHQRWHPRRWVARDGVRGWPPQPDAPMTVGGGPVHVA
jgi:hypothetical protein